MFLFLKSYLRCLTVLSILFSFFMVLSCTDSLSPPLPFCLPSVGLAPYFGLGRQERVFVHKIKLVLFGSSVS